MGGLLSCCRVNDEDYDAQRALLPDSLPTPVATRSMAATIEHTLRVRAWSCDSGGTGSTLTPGSMAGSSSDTLYGGFFGSAFSLPDGAGQHRQLDRNASSITITPHLSKSVQ
ncbi:uncharacterized protein LOC144129676 [Amblyomma americanum]